MIQSHGPHGDPISTENAVILATFDGEELLKDYQVSRHQNDNVEIRGSVVDEVQGGHDIQVEIESFPDQQVMNINSAGNPPIRNNHTLIHSTIPKKYLERASWHVNNRIKYSYELHLNLFNSLSNLIQGE